MNKEKLLHIFEQLTSTWCSECVLGDCKTCHVNTLHEQFENIIWNRSENGEIMIVNNKYVVFYRDCSYWYTDRNGAEIDSFDHLSNLLEDIETIETIKIYG